MLAPQLMAKRRQVLPRPSRQASSNVKGEAAATTGSHCASRRKMQKNSTEATVLTKTDTVSTSTGGLTSPPAAKLITNVNIMRITIGTLMIARAISVTRSALKKYFRCLREGIRASLMLIFIPRFR